MSRMGHHIPTNSEASSSMLWEAGRKYSLNFTAELSMMLDDCSLISSCSFDKACTLQLTNNKSLGQCTVQEEVQQQPCIFCGQECRGLKGLKQHIAKTNTKIRKEERCPICGKLFNTKHALRFHQRQVQEKLTRVKCPECSKVIYNKYMLQKHLASHCLKSK
mmetsp:Transcript_5234/g.9601  ORF Transcript_5234/g.9601 Transcript_5234/m.9601 type:complete len:162 (-) Transcript_5234:2-487(-)